MVTFVKQFDERLKATDEANYYREQYQSFMTGPEWRSVEMAEEFAQMLDDGTSIFQFPYLRQTWDLWKVLYHSFAAARKYNGFFEIMFSEYMMMDLFVVIFTTFELVPKGIASLILSPFLEKKNDTAMQKHLAEYFKKYAKDLQTIPFYDHNYKEIRVDLAQKYHACTSKTWGDWFSWRVVSFELWARTWICKPLKYWFHQEGNQTPASTDIIVKFDAENTEDSEQAKALFQQTLTSVSKDYPVALVSEQIYAKEKPKTKDGATYISVYARLSAPRYMEFQPVVLQLAEKGINIRKIAGQDRVQVKCSIDGQNSDDLNITETTLNATEQVKACYSYGNRIHSHRKICLFDVPVENLHERIKQLAAPKDVTVRFIHNF